MLKLFEARERKTKLKEMTTNRTESKFSLMDFPLKTLSVENTESFSQNSLNHEDLNHLCENYKPRMAFILIYNIHNNYSLTITTKKNHL